MARSTGVVLAVGGITIFNDVILNSRSFSWRIPVATTIAALGFAGFEHLAPEVAVGMAWLALVAVVFTRVNPSVPAPAESLMTMINSKRSG